MDFALVDLLKMNPPPFDFKTSPFVIHRNILRTPDHYYYFLSERLATCCIVLSWSLDQLFFF